MPMPSRSVPVCVMSRTAGIVPVRVAYSSFAVLAGTAVALCAIQRLFLMRWASPKSVSATRLRVLSVAAEVFVTHSSMRLIFTPERTLGNCVIQPS